jgi:glycosyltransferase involved in cell wall biosynthesis
MPAMNVSVIIPAYNGASYIEQAIGSVWGQSWSPCEIIVVDDGSTDHTGTLVKSLSGPVPIRYYRQDNQGQGAARNLGASLAQGDWLAFLDQDDLWCPQKLQAQMEYAGMHSDSKCVFSIMDYIDKEERPLRQPDTSSNDLLAPILHGHPLGVFPSTVLIEKRLFNYLGGFDSSLRIGEDADLFARVARMSALHCIPRALVHYRLHDGQAHRDKRYWEGSWPLFHNKMWDFWRDNPRNRSILLRATAQIYSSIGKNHAKRGEHEIAREYFHKSYECYPWSWRNLRRWASSALARTMVKRSRQPQS